MKSLVTLVNVPLLVTLLVIGGVILIAVFILLYIFVFSRNVSKRAVKDLERKFSYLDALLIGQDSQYIHRLEIVSRTNLLYVDRYSEFSRRFKEIYEIDDRFAESKIKQAKNMIAGKQYRNIKGVLEDVRRAVSSFEEKVNQLDTDLYEIIKPEEESRQTILKLKESYRSVKQTFYASADDVEIVLTSFNKAFDKLDESFSEFETHIDSAEYDEANALIPIISSVVTALKSALEQMPNLCILVTKIIPDKIDEITLKHNELEANGFPLFNITFRSRHDDWNYSLSQLKKKLIALQVAGVLDECNKIQDEIAEVDDLLRKEIEDKEFFTSNNNSVYKNVLDLEKNFLKVYSLLPDIQKIYIIDENQQQKLEELKESINKLGVSKRSLDAFVHSSTPQPYSTLREKLEVLINDYELASDKLNTFKTYLADLRTSSEEAYNMVFAYYYRLKSTEASLNDLLLPNIVESYKESIDNCYQLLDEIDKNIKITPIDVSLINSKVEALKSSASVLFETVDTMCREAKLAESAIVYANRDRVQQAEVNEGLNALEERFYQGDFESVYHDATELYHKTHVENHE